MSVKKSLAWMGVAQGASFLVQFASSVVLAHYLSPHEMGIFGIGLASVGMLALLQSFGLQPLVVREKVLTKSIETTVFTANAIICIVQSAATLALAYAGASFLGDQGVKHILIVLAVIPLIGIFSFLPGAQLERHARFKESALITGITSVIGGCATIILAVLGFNYMSMAYGQVISAVTLAALFMTIGRDYRSLRVGLSEWRKVGNFGLQIFAYAGIVNFSQRFCEVMLGRILGLASLGLYNRASGINNMLWGNIHYLVSRVILVDFASLHRSGVPLKARYMQTVAIVTATLWPAFAGLAVLAGPFIVIVYGAKWATATVPLIFLTIASIIRVSMTMSWELFAVTGNIRAQTRVETKRTLISMLLFIGACFVSIEAVAFTRIIDALVAFVLYRPHLNRMSNTTLRDLAGTYMQSAILTLAAIFPSSVFLLLARNTRPHITVLVLAVGLGVALWVGGLFVLHHRLANEIRKLWLQLRKQRTRQYL